MSANHFFKKYGVNEKLNRREFLKQQAGAAMLLAGGTAGLSLPRSLWAAGTPDISVVTGEPGPATRKAIEMLGGMSAFVRPGNRVVIKPNMSFAHDTDRATNTHPDVVRELVAMCKEADAGRIRVLDHPLRNAEMCIEGIRKACGVFNEDMVYGLTRSKFYKPAKIVRGVDMKETDVMRDVSEADVLIAAPVAKSHGSAGVSLSMKGMMGLIWNRWIMHSRYDLHSAIADLASLLTPQLVVVDASRVLSTDGPSGPGKVLKAKTIIASADMVAADAQTVRMFEWYGRRFEPRQVKHIRLAHERGLGRMDVENLSVRQVAL
ncbi:DUF362 domain-containing protein [Desulfonema ishimotonii]|uniref:DUF362 domain-containing protein n=1 Tax=Desulfonema ishimotonii TaxID=45657 RepID=A0A401FX99_9BACT|nr:DUF362 domain-containing protein [Desulfonema ishimotonii]GBC61576.1 DUF362 domain-containing protein [Desulfonema ishimotonii]